MCILRIAGVKGFKQLQMNRGLDFGFFHTYRYKIKEFVGRVLIYLPASVLPEADDRKLAWHQPANGITASEYTSGCFSY